MLKVTQLQYSWNLDLECVTSRLRTGTIIVVLRSMRNCL